MNIVKARAKASQNTATKYAGESIKKIERRKKSHNQKWRLIKSHNPKSKSRIRVSKGRAILLTWGSKVKTEPAKAGWMGEMSILLLKD